MTKSAISVQGVSQHFSANENTVVALDAIDLEIPRGQFIALVGPSGCGKSTLLSLAAGLRLPTAGGLFCDGEPISKPMPQKIGMIFQEANLLPWLSALENVAFPLKLRGIAKRERLDAAMKMLELTGLDGFAEQLPHQLSGGMKQRVSIDRGLCRTQACCCSTSHSQRLTSRPAWCWAMRFCGFGPARARRLSSSLTIYPRRFTWLIALLSSVPGPAASSMMS